MQDARVYSHGGPIGCRTREYVITMDQSDARIANIFYGRESGKRRREVTRRVKRVYSHGGDQSDGAPKERRESEKRRREVMGRVKRVASSKCEAMPSDPS